MFVRQSTTSAKSFPPRETEMQKQSLSRVASKRNLPHVPFHQSTHANLIQSDPIWSNLPSASVFRAWHHAMPKSDRISVTQFWQLEVMAMTEDSVNQKISDLGRLFCRAQLLSYSPKKARVFLSCTCFRTAWQCGSDQIWSDSMLWRTLGRKRLKVRIGIVS